MLIETLETPITVLNVGQYGIDIEQMQDQLRAAYSEFEWDSYLLQQKKIERIKEAATTESIAAVSNVIWHDIYTGVIQDSDLPSLLPWFSSIDALALGSLEPTRKRCMSEYELKWVDGWRIERIPSNLVVQTRALIASDQEIDYRKSSRKFMELPDALFDSNMRAMLAGVADMVKQSKPSISRLNVAVHHTIVYCHPKQVTTNSPEGIHQDGVDFIVSALVVERKNITGGNSVIYGKDRRTKLLQIELQAGQGIFQADAGTDLWHEVTPITVIDRGEIGYRSTIGFDVTIPGERIDSP